MQETAWLSSLVEAKGATQKYQPWFGRGFFQLTSWPNYIAYWRWLGKKVPLELTDQSGERIKASLSGPKLPLSKSANALLATLRSLQMRDASESAGWYWLSRQVATYADEPHVLKRVEVQVILDDNTSTTRCFYRSEQFWKCSASINLPARIGHAYDTALNGFVSRAVADMRR